MRSLILFVCCISLLCSFAQAQQKFKVSKGSIDFSSDAPLEVIEASSTALRGIIDPATSKFAFVVKINTFQGFNSDLQRQHFNENYMESDTYPEATFAGKIIEDIDYSQDGTHQVRAKGKLSIHGVSQTRLFRAKLEIKGGKMTIKVDKLIVPLADHDISIPTIVSQKIATEINVQVVATLNKE